ncbi:MAG: sugar ABC transporter permease [Chloroflexi bacterium RBG_13_60_13]|nr:MAG: sugar ABC transporter permease [Chloroflexi bacterium RBG_13_60_13]
MQIAIVFAAILLWVLFLIGSPRTFLSYPIYGSFMSTTPYFALMAIPLTLVIIAGEIDLSFGSIMAFGMTAFSVVFIRTNNLTLGFVACLLAGLFAGLLNGAIVVKVGIPSLVTTLGTQFFWRGVVLVVTAGNGVGLQVAQRTILAQALVGRLAGRIPAQMLWTIAVAVVVWFFLNRHKFGAHVYLVGDNVESARLMGVNVERTKMLTFALVGLAAAFAGFVMSLQLLYFWPTLGEGFLMNTLASVFLGGTSVFGGTGTIFGTFVASFIIGAINAGIVAAGLTGFWTQLIYGLIIIVSVSVQAVLRRKLA